MQKLFNTENGHRIPLGKKRRARYSGLKMNIPIHMEILRDATVRPPTHGPTTEETVQIAAALKHAGLAVNAAA